MQTSRRAFLAGGSAAILAGVAPRIAWGRTEADVGIIGAGLAGLNAARHCEAAGLSVVVIEAANRIGGRLHTLRDLPGAPEAGGIQVGAGYTRLHAIAAELGVGLSSDAGAGAGRVSTPGNLYWVNGERSMAEDWNSRPRNPLDSDQITTEPASLLRQYLGQMTRFDNVNDWLTADPAVDVSVSIALRKLGASREALRLIEANFNGNDLDSMSQLHLARSLAIFRSQPGPVSTIEGGSQLLPETMAGSLSADIHIGEPVRAILEESDGISIRLSDHVITARQAICTIPFSAMPSGIVSAPVSPAMAHVMASLPYTRASFAYISASEPFWRDDPFPDTLWTDDPLIGRVFVLGEDPPMLKLWTTGAGADLLDRMPPDRAKAEIVRRVEQMRPSAAGKLSVERLFSWQKDPFARGIYHHIGTGMAHDMATACQEQRRRLHFAGEHLAIANSGMEGALESGERAAAHVLAHA